MSSEHHHLQNQTTPQLHPTEQILRSHQHHHRNSNTPKHQNRALQQHLTITTTHQHLQLHPTESTTTSPHQHRQNSRRRQTQSNHQGGRQPTAHQNI
ncbi:hypothetical protein QL285_005535 [Trifolium repens]|nr:hypothetical protein QL285_005535 [Trifolium repens]